MDMGLRALGRPVSKLLSLEEEPPSLAQAELSLRKSSLKQPSSNDNGHGAPVQLAPAARARFVISPAANEFRKRRKIAP